MLVVRCTHSQLVDNETVVVSQFIVVDVTSAQLFGTVGPPCYSVAAADAEFVGDTPMLLVTCPLSSRQAAGETSAKFYKAVSFSGGFRLGPGGTGPQILPRPPNI